MLRPMRLADPATLPEVETTPQSDARELRDPGYLVICWNDPVNLMSYVTHVFQQVFGWNRQKAEKHMLEVHAEGRSVLVRESFEQAEFRKLGARAIRLRDQRIADDSRQESGPALRYCDAQPRIACRHLPNRIGRKR